MLLALGLLLSCGLASTSCRSEEEKSFNALMKTSDECKMDLESAVCQFDIDQVVDRLKKVETQIDSLKLDTQEWPLQQETLKRRYESLQAIAQIKPEIIKLSIAMNAVPTKQGIQELTQKCVANGDTANIGQIVRDFWKEQARLIEGIEIVDTLQSQEVKELLDLRHRTVKQLRQNAWVTMTTPKLPNEGQMLLLENAAMNSVKQTNELALISLNNEVLLTLLPKEQLKKILRINIKAGNKAEKAEKYYFIYWNTDGARKMRYYEKCILELDKLLKELTSVLLVQLEVLDDVLIKHGGRYVN